MELLGREATLKEVYPWEQALRYCIASPNFQVPLPAPCLRGDVNPQLPAAVAPGPPNPDRLSPLEL